MPRTDTRQPLPTQGRSHRRCGHQQALREKLPDEPQAAGPERDPNRRLARPARRASNVAMFMQARSNRHPTAPATKTSVSRTVRVVRLQRRHQHVEVGGVSRVGRLAVPVDCGQFLLGGRNRRPGMKPTEDGDPARSAGPVSGFPGPEQRPELEAGRPIEHPQLEIGWHHSDDFVRHVVERDRRPDDRFGRPEATLPQSHGSAP